MLNRLPDNWQRRPRRVYVRDGVTLLLYLDQEAAQIDVYERANRAPLVRYTKTVSFPNGGKARVAFYSPEDIEKL